MSRAVSHRTAALAAAVLAAVVACSDTVVNPVSVARIDISPETSTLAIGAQARLTATLRSADGNPLGGRTVSWQSLDPATAEVDGSGNVSALAPGTARIRASADALADTAVVTVLDRPLLVLTPDTVEFTAAVNGASPGDRTVTVGRSGDGALNQLTATIRYAAGQPTGWLGTALASTSAPTTLTLSASHAGLQPGTYSAEVDVASPGAGNSPARLTARVVVQGPGPAIALSAYAASFSALVAGANPAAQTIALTNSGGSTLTGLSTVVSYADGEPTGWLNATLGGTSAPTSLTLAAATAALPAGTYTATVQVRSTRAGVHPVALTVTFAVIAPAPTIAIGTSSVSFAATRGGADPVPQTLPITNAGGGTLGDLQVSVAYASGQPSGWLSATLNGTTAPASLTVRAETGSLPTGSYSATVLVTSPAAGNSPVSLTVSFTVVDQQPAISLSATNRTFSATRLGASPTAQTVSITNGGGGTLSALQASVTYAQGQPTGWLGTALNQTSAPATLTLQPATGSLAVGTYTATVHIASAIASNSPQTVTVTFTVADQNPSIALSATTRSFTAVRGSGNPPQQTVAITNAGGGTLGGLSASVSYASGQPTGWLTASVSPATAPSTLTLTAATGSLPTGTYTATVNVASGPASNSPQTVTVTFVVTEPAPVISVATSAVTFNATQGAGSPAQQTVAVTNTGGGTLSGLATSITYGSGQPANWLTASISPTTAPATITLTAVTGSLTAGTYTATVNVTSGVAANSPRSVTVTFVVAPPAPSIVLSATSRTFSAVQGGANPGAQTVSITNGGGGTLAGLGAAVSYAAGQPAGWLTASLDQATAPATLTLTPATGSLAPGAYTATVAVTSGVASNSPQSVTVTFTVNEPGPAIGLSSTTATFNAVAGGSNPGNQGVTITNTGGGTLTGLAAAVAYEIGQPTGWLSATVSPPSAPSTLTLGASVAGLPAGTYTATVHITSGIATNSPQQVTVTFVVAEPPPALGLASGSATFAAEQGGADPAPATIAITNTGGGTLAGLSAAVLYATGQPTGWLAVDIDSTTAPTTLTLTPATGALPAGTYTASVQVAAPAATNSPRIVAVTFTITEPEDGG